MRDWRCRPGGYVIASRRAPRRIGDPHYAGDNGRATCSLRDCSLLFKSLAPALEDNFHPGADEGGGVGLGCVHWVYVDLEVRTEGNAMSEAEAVKRFENAFVILPGPIRFQCWFRIERAC